MSERPIEVLNISKRYGGATMSVDRTDAWGTTYPVWTVVGSAKDKSIAILYADPRMQAPNGSPLGTARFHSLSSKIDVTLRGAEFKMRNEDLLGLSTKHVFSFLGASSMAWRQSGMSSSTIYYEDAAGRRLACYKKRPGGFAGRSAPCIELYVPAASLDMDLLVVTGIAAISSAKKNKKEEEEAGGEILGALLG